MESNPKPRVTKKMLLDLRRQVQEKKALEQKEKQERRIIEQRLDEEILQIQKESKQLEEKRKHLEKELQKKKEERKQKEAILKSIYERNDAQEHILIMQQEQIKEERQAVQGLKSAILQKRDNLAVLEEQKINEKEQHDKRERQKMKLYEMKHEKERNIRTFCRIRPATQAQLCVQVQKDGLLKLWKRVNKVWQQHQRPDTSSSLKTQRYKEQDYAFEKVFEPNDGQQIVFDYVSNVVRNIITGHNVLIFAYGQTNSGKTYTMLGPSRKDKSLIYSEKESGILTRSMELVFEELNWPHLKNTFHLSIKEIYVKRSQNLIENCGIKDCKEVKSFEQVFQLLNLAVQKRKTNKTNMNESSSRSHLFISLKFLSKDEKNQISRDGSFTVVDLAGNQNITMSGASKQKQYSLFKQATSINSSLLGLGKVIRAIAEDSAKPNQISKKRESIGFRDYELTWQLKPFLKQGKFKVLLFVNISPDEQYFTQTKVTLDFGQAAYVAQLKQ